MLRKLRRDSFLALSEPQIYCFSYAPKSGALTARGFPSRSTVRGVTSPLSKAVEEDFSLKLKTLFCTSMLSNCGSILLIMAEEVILAGIFLTFHNELEKFTMNIVLPCLLTVTSSSTD